MFEGILSKKKKEGEVVDDSKHLPGCSCLVCKPTKVEAEGKVKAKSKKKDAVIADDSEGGAQSSAENDKAGTISSKKSENATIRPSGTTNSGNKSLEGRVSAIEDRLKGNNTESGFWVVFATILVIGMCVMIAMWLPTAGEIPFIHMRFK